MNYVNLVIDNKNRNTDRFYTYGTKESLDVGDVVDVEFGKGKTLKRAWVVETDVLPDIEAPLIKEVQSKNNSWRLSKEAVETSLWMKKRYGIRYVDALRLFSPHGTEPKRKLKANPDEHVAELPKLNLNREQEAALEAILRPMRESCSKAFLLHGVTGSGKTEVYMQAMEEALEAGKNIIYMVPEISLIQQTYDRLAGRFGKNNIAVLHSKISPANLYNQWSEVFCGSAKIVLGTRMAVFAPISKLGLIIMDEEHEGSYKSDMTPKFETLDVAYKRCFALNGVLILGSATPSISNFKLAKDGVFDLISLRERYNKVPLPQIELVDMKNELREGNSGIISGRLYQALTGTISKNKQAILFINRRGYSSYIGCRECGHSLSCPKCGIALTYHKSDNSAVCHYCGRRFNVPQHCPNCNSEKLRKFGFGTEKLAEEIGRLFPNSNIDRLDLDTAVNTSEIKGILKKFREGATDILIGTQLVAKSLDFKNVDLVGVLNSDISLNIADYRAAERTFQLITQVAGRAGRGDYQGHVIVQSGNPENFAIKEAAKGDYEEFFNREIRVRKLLSYPPYTDLVKISISGKDKEKVVSKIRLCADNLKTATGVDKSLVFEPREDFISKGRDTCRYEFIVKCPKALRMKLIDFAESFSFKLAAEREGLSLFIDVNPY